MNPLHPKKLIAATTMVLACTGVQSAGFQRVVASDPTGKPLEVGIWYPSASAVQSADFGPVNMSVSINAPVAGTSLPLVVMSHGTGSSFLGHFDTAIALADAGFVVAAVTHTGDNYRDQSRSVEIMDRPRQISIVIDYMLKDWSQHNAISNARIGMFGFSAGGFTTLVSVGGKPAFEKIAPMCAEYPGDFACQLLAKNTRTTSNPPSAQLADGRIKAAVVAAPALGFTFSPDGLKEVNVPVQLWRAEKDALLPHPRYAEAVRQALPRAPEYHVVPNAGHFDFLAPCSKAMADIAPDICVSAPGFDRGAFHSQFNASVVAFFKSTLDKR